MSKYKPPGRPPDKAKSPTVAETTWGTSVSRQSPGRVDCQTSSNPLYRTDSDCQPLTLSVSGNLPSYCTKSRPKIQHTGRQGVIMPPNHTAKNSADRLRLVLSDLRQQTLNWNTNQPDTATPDQVKILLSLYRRLGEKLFLTAKWECGILAKVTYMTRHEAGRLINHLTEGPLK